jgi:hypothetical protein
MTQTLKTACARATQVEPFTGHRQFGIPFLQTWKHRKTMSVVWGEGSAHYPEFKLALDKDAMAAELLAIWRRCKPQCRRGAEFAWGGMHGHMSYVPVDAGTEAMAVVRKHFIKALQDMPAKRAAFAAERANRENQDGRR